MKTTEQPVGCRAKFKRVVLTSFSFDPFTPVAEQRLLLKGGGYDCPGCEWPDDRDTASLKQLARVVGGLLNKQIAAELGTSENTVKTHRHQVMEKMGANSLAELVRMARRLGRLITKS